MKAEFGFYDTALEAAWLTALPASLLLTVVLAVFLIG